MKRILTFFLLMYSVSVVWGSSQCDSLKIFFNSNKATLSPALNSESSVNIFIDSVSAYLQSGALNQISVYGYASPEGPLPHNNRLSARRSEAVANYISRHAGVPMSQIHTCPEGVAWDGLRELVISTPITPDRVEVLRILNEYIPEMTSDASASDRCLAQLRSLDGGHTYQWMLANLFPDLRYALAVCSYTVPEFFGVLRIPENMEYSPKTVCTEDINIVTPPYLESDNSRYIKPLHRLAIKTNLLYDAALLPNLEVEWRVSDNWSVALEGGVAWWGKYSNEHSYRLAMVSPEVRRWIRPRAPWHGLYVGAFAGAGLYDLEKTTRGYRGEGVMGGVSVGYMWPISRYFSLEAEVGGGYLFTRYKEYVPISGHHVYRRTKDLNYFGPLKVKFSIVWRLWDVNRKARQSARKHFPEAL